MGNMQRLRQLCWAVLRERTNRNGDRRSCQLNPRSMAYAATVSPARHAHSCSLACPQGGAAPGRNRLPSCRPDTRSCQPKTDICMRSTLQAAHSLPHPAAPSAPRPPRAAGCSRPAASTAPRPRTPRPACPAAPPRRSLHPRCWPPQQMLRRLRAQRCLLPPRRTPHLPKHHRALTHRA